MHYVNFAGEESYPQAIYLGCYGEKMGDDKNRLLKFPHERYEDNTPQKCSEECFKIGFLYSGTTNGEKLGYNNKTIARSISFFICVRPKRGVICYCFDGPAIPMFSLP